MFQKIKKLYHTIIQIQALKEENIKLKETLFKLDPKFHILPFLKTLDIQDWKMEDGEIQKIEMGYFDYAITTMQNFVKTHINKEALYISLRKITSERMEEIEARNFIYSFFIVLEIADDIPDLEVKFQKIIASKNMKVLRKYDISR